MHEELTLFQVYVQILHVQNFQHRSGMLQMLTSDTIINQ
jgi:hypothetical protein